MADIGYLRRKWFDRTMSVLSSSAAGLAILVLALILGYTIVQGIAFFNGVNIEYFPEMGNFVSILRMIFYQQT